MNKYIVINLIKLKKDRTYGGFDITIGNPPYGAKLSSKELENYKKNYNNKASETAILFIEKGMSLTSPNGFLIYIIPKSFTFSSNYSSIRNYVENELDLLVDCGKAFEKVKLEACIIGLKRNNISHFYKSIHFNSKKRLEIIGNIDKNLKETFGFYPNGISEAELSIGLKILNNSISLNDIATNSRGESLQKHIKSNGILPVIGGKELGRYGIKGIKGYITDEELISEKAKISDHSVLVQNIVAHITKPYHQIKIIATIPNHKKVFLILDTINQITLKDKRYSVEIIWALLNSKIINWYAYLFIFSKAIRTMHFDNSVTQKIPVPKNINRVSEKIEKRVSLLSSLTDESMTIETTKIELEIDCLFYKLYNVTFDEVKIIDPNFPLTQIEYNDI